MGTRPLSHFPSAGAQPPANPGDPVLAASTICQPKGGDRCRGPPGRGFIQQSDASRHLVLGRRHDRVQRGRRVPDAKRARDAGWRRARTPVRWRSARRPLLRCSWPKGRFGRVRRREW